MPPRAEVLVASHSDYLQKKFAIDWLPRAGHRVVATITEVADAPGVIFGLADRRAEVDVAIVTDSKGGAELSKILRRVYPGVRIIAITSGEEKPVWANRILRSERLDPLELNDLITKL